MKKTIRLERLEETYQAVIGAFEDAGGKITPDVLVRLSLELYRDIRDEGIALEVPDDDMLLYQCGVWNWGDERGEHFSFDITRQLTEPGVDEGMHQLSFSLIYDPAPFVKTEIETCWSIDFDTLEEFEAYIRSTPAYREASAVVPREVRLHFDEV